VSNADSAAGPLPHHPLHIAGQWREGHARRRFDAINPYTGCAWATVAQAEVEDVAAAIVAARDTFERWSRVSGYERGRLMAKLADLLEGDAERMGRLENYRQRQDHPRDSDADGIGGAAISLLRRLCGQAVGTANSARPARRV
jgi:phenylacetaldehyde dehydrogenase